MSTDEVPPDLLEQMGTVASLCEEENIRVKSLSFGNFASEELMEEYESLKSIVNHHEDISRVKVERELAKQIEIDETRECRYYLWDIAVVQKQGILKETYPEFTGGNSGDLIGVSPEADMNKNSFEYKNHYLILCSRLSQNYRLVGKLNQVRTETVNLAVPITYSKIGLPDTTRQSKLAAHWRGPETLQELQDRSGHEFFVQKGTESYDHGLQDRTEFYFEKRDGKWHLQIEELMPRTGIRHSLHTSLADEMLKYYTRYLHAIVDEECEQCFHLDGALRSYGTLDDFIDRHVNRELQNPNPLKRMSKRRKLFKIDSPEGDLSDFGEIAGLFFRNNPHVLRFFEGDSEWAEELEEKRARLLEFGLSTDRVQEQLKA